MGSAPLMQFCDIGSPISLILKVGATDVRKGGNPQANHSAPSTEGPGKGTASRRTFTAVYALVML